MNNVETLIKLSEYSDVVKQVLSKDPNKLVKVHITRFYEMRYVKPISFFPNGNCGCVELNDDHAFGIRCDKLIWIEGSIEETQRYAVKIKKALLVYGNHKGSLESRLITFKETNKEHTRFTLSCI